MSIIDNLTEIIPMKVIAKQHHVSTSTVTKVLRSTERKKQKFYLLEKLGIN